jgi:hypothetical protein
LINVQIDESVVRELCLEKIEEAMKTVEKDLVFWDANELKRRTCMGWNSIVERFFGDSRFPRYKIGTKWFFPADETKKYLLTWLSEQSRV